MCFYHCNHHCAIVSLHLSESKLSTIFYKIYWSLIAVLAMKVIKKTEKRLLFLRKTNSFSGAWSLFSALLSRSLLIHHWCLLALQLFALSNCNLMLGAALCQSVFLLLSFLPPFSFPWLCSHPELVFTGENPKAAATGASSLRVRVHPRFVPFRHNEEQC